MSWRLVIEFFAPGATGPLPILGLAVPGAGYDDADLIVRAHPFLGRCLSFLAFAFGASVVIEQLFT